MSDTTTNITNTQASDSGDTPVREKPQRRRIQRPKALPLRTWLLVLMVLVLSLIHI